MLCGLMSNMAQIPVRISCNFHFQQIDGDDSLLFH